VDFPHPLVGQQEVEMLVGPDTFRHFWLGALLSASSATSSR